MSAIMEIFHALSNRKTEKKCSHKTVLKQSSKNNDFDKKNVTAMICIKIFWAKWYVLQLKQAILRPFFISILL